jgi:zinc protease
MSVFIVGTIDPDKIEKQIQSMFSDVKAKSVARKKAPHTVPDHQQTFVQIVTDPEATNASVDIIYKHRFNQVKNLMDYRSRVEQMLYNRMLGRRLSDLTKTANPPFIFAGTGYGQDVGDLATYGSYATADPKDIKRAYQVLLDENQRVLQYGFTQGELDREKANLIRQAEQSVAEEDKQESNRVVSRYVGNFLDGTPIPSAGQTMDMYKSMLPTITVDEVSQLAKAWITKQSRVIIVTGPEKDKAMLPDSVELIGLMNAAAGKTLDPYLEIDLSKPLLEGNFPPLPIVKSDHDAALDVYHWEFANGVTVTAKPTEFKNDEILMAAYSPGGSSLYGDDLFPSARSASNVVGTSGVGTYKAADLEKKLTGFVPVLLPLFSNVMKASMALLLSGTKKL